MQNLPSIKTHPVIVSLFVMTFLLIFGISCTIGGWWLRAASESRAELSVVVDDGKFMQALELQTQKWVTEYNKWSEKFYEENKDIPSCITNPMPHFYRDNDYILRSTRKQEE